MNENVSKIVAGLAGLAKEFDRGFTNPKPSGDYCPTCGKKKDDDGEQ